VATKAPRHKAKQSVLIIFVCWCLGGVDNLPQNAKMLLSSAYIQIYSGIQAHVI
jgi:hypothetical protein